MKILVFIAVIAALIFGGIHFGIIPVNPTENVSEKTSAEVVSDEEDIIPDTDEPSQEESESEEIAQEVEVAVEIEPADVKEELKAKAAEERRLAKEKAAAELKAKIERAYQEGVRLTGGAALTSLAVKVDDIDDEFVDKSTGKEARLKIMKCLRGQIAGVNYHLVGEKKIVGEIKGGAFGSEYKGPLKGPQFFPPPGEYIAEVPSTFQDGMKKLAFAVRGKHVGAGAQAAALYFMDAVKNNKTLTESKMYSLIKTAATKGGNDDALLLSGVCNYYGIGTTRNRAAAVKILKKWAKNHPDDYTAGGWIHERITK